MSYDLEKVIVWNYFKEKFLVSLDDIPPFEVDLSFEYKEVNGQVVSYSSGDEIYFCDIKLTSEGHFRLEVPYGTHSRFFSLSDADSISHPTIGNLEDYLNECYSEALGKASKDGETTKLPVSLKDFVSDLQKRKDKREVVNVLNNSSEHIKKTVEAEKNKAAFQTIDEFGMF